MHLWIAISVLLVVFGSGDDEGIATPVEVAKIDLPALQKLETLCLDARRNLWSGELQITSQIAIHRKNKRYQQTLAIVFDHDQIRIDTIRPEFDDANVPTSVIRTVHARNCVYPGYQFAFRRTPDQIQPQFTASFMALEIAEPRLIFDPRLIGYIPEGTLNLFRYSFLDLVGRFSAATDYSLDVASGDRLLRVSTTEGSGVIRTLWIAPEQGFNVVKAVWSSKLGEGDSNSTYTHEILSRLERFGDENLWFPVEVKYEARRGEVILKTHVSIVEVRKLNEPIDDERFALSSMNLPEGTRIVKFQPNEKSEITGAQGYWDGTSILPLPVSSAGSSGDPRVALRGISRSRLIVSISALLFAMLLGLWGFIARRRSFSERET